MKDLWYCELSGTAKQLKDTEKTLRDHFYKHFLQTLSDEEQKTIKEAGLTFD